MSPGGRGEAGGTSSHQHRQEGSSIRSNSGVALEQHCFTPCVPYIARERRTGELKAIPQVKVSEQHALQRRDVTYRACGVG